MKHNRAQRVGDLLLDFLGGLLVRELADPRLRFVTLTGVDVRRDLKHVDVSFRVRQDETSREEAMAGLKQATGFIRAKIASELKLRFVPTIVFVFDETPDRGQRIDDLLRQASSK